MARFLNDPLLHGTKGLLRVAYMLCFGVALFLAVVATVAFLSGDVLTPERLTPARLRDGIVLMFSLIPLLAIVGWFLRTLWRIVGTVAAGSPFTGANADRLTRMAWLALLLKGASVVRSVALGEAETPVDVSGGLLLALTLFILARVIRQGAAMREDLEGTV